MKLFSLYHNRILLILCASILIFAGCNNAQNNQANMYTYADGSNNTYTIQNGDSPTLIYNPVKPAESSSGEYDGGTPVNKTISVDQFEAIAALMEKAIANTAVHIDGRPMLSGQLTASEGEGKRNVVLRPGCEEMQAIENALKAAAK